MTLPQRPPVHRPETVLLIYSLSHKHPEALAFREDLRFLLLSP